MANGVVTYELRDKIALIGLNRPEKRNAINDELLAELTEAVQRAGREADAGVLYGHGPLFSSGLDLAQLADKLRNASKPTNKRVRYNWHSTFDLISRGSIPFVAAIHNAAIGGGMELAAAAHIRVAEDTAVFGLPEGRRGIFVGGGGSVWIQRLVGYPVMADMMLTGRMLSAEDARAARFVQYVVPEGDALSKAISLAETIAGNTHQTNWQITNVLPRMNDASHDDALFMEFLNASLVRPPEALQRLEEFLGKKSEKLKLKAGSD